MIGYYGIFVILKLLCVLMYLFCVVYRNFYYHDNKILIFIMIMKITMLPDALSAAED